jgi:hypothetical protein
MYYWKRLVTVTSLFIGLGSGTDTSALTQVNRALRGGGVCQLRD